MMTINERVKQVRNTLKMTQKDFGQRLTLAQTYLSQIENGDRDVTEKIQKLLCLEFNVNEEWLRNGSGEMFNAPTATYIDSLVEKYSLDSLDRQILENYAKLDENKKAAIKKFILDVAKSYNQEQINEPATEKTSPVQPEQETPEDIEAWAAEEAEAYRLELIAEKEAEISPVLGDINAKNA